MPRRRISLSYVLAAGAIPLTLAACVYSIVTANLEFVYYSGWIVVFILGVIWLDRRVGVPTALLLGLAAWALVHFLGGIVPIPERFTEPGSRPALYNLRLHPLLPKYDQVVHCLGFMVATMTAWVGLRATYRDPPRFSFGLGLAIVLMGMGLGAMNEVIEFIATRLFPDTNVGGYDNTGWDLVSNLTGCVVALAFVRRTLASGGTAPAAAPGRAAPTARAD